jgi:hypothetical protein
MLQYHRLRDHGTHAAGPDKSRNHAEGMYTQKDGVAHQSIVPDDQILYFTPELGIRHPQVRPPQPWQNSGGSHSTFLSGKRENRHFASSPFAAKP